MIWKNRFRTAAAVIGLCILMLSFSCGKKEGKSNACRLLDNFNSEGIISSPLSAGSEIKEGKGLFPEKSRPLFGMSAEKNPLGLIRKLKIGGREINVLMSPPGSEYMFSPESSPPVEMDFGIGIVSGKSRGAAFQIILEKNGRRKTVYQKYLEVPSEKEHIFFKDRIELPYEISGTRLILSTRGEEDVHSFWFNPVLYSQEKLGRKVILISIDTLRADHLHCYGYERDTSPNIDALAEDGALFENTLAPAPWTLPSHVSLLTSLYGAHHQVYHEDERMDPGMTTLAEMMHSRGFLCSAFTGGGFVSSVYGFSKGFASYQEGEGGVFHQDSAQRMFAAVSDWLKVNRERDFFLFIHTYQPHSPYACPPPYKTMYLEETARFGHIDLLGHLGGRSNIFRELPEDERRNIIALYDGEIRYTDERLIGPLMETLKQLEIYDESLIVFTSDHGEEFFEHGGWGHGQSLYNESLKVPLIVKFPDSRHKGVRFPGWVSLVDVMPTILDECRLKYSRKDFDGVSLIPYLEDRTAPSRRLLADVGEDVLGFHLPRKTAAVQDENKVIFRERMDKENLEFFSVPPPYIRMVEMYNLDADPEETRNVADSNPVLVNGIISRVKEVYRNAVPRRTGKAEVDRQVKEQLKALGYIR